MVKKILILGGTGAMGSFLVEYLNNKDNELYVTSRRAHQDNGNIRYLKGDAHSISFIKSILDEKYDAIIYFMYYELKEFKERCELFLSSTDQYFLISSSRVYANSNSPLTEKSKRLFDGSEANIMPPNDYALVKAQEEDLLRNSSYRNWTIIRPYMTYFQYRLDLGYYPKELWLYRIIKGKTIILPSKIVDKYTTLTFGYDVARGIASLICEKKALGEIFHITYNKSYTWKEIFSVYKECIENNGYKVNYKEIDLAGDSCECIFKYDRYYNRLFDNTKIGYYINTSDFIDTKKGIAMCITNFLQHQQFLKINWAQQAYWDRLLHEKTNLEDIVSKKDQLIYLFFRFIIPYAVTRNIYRTFKSIIRR